MWLEDEIKQSQGDVNKKRYSEKLKDPRWQKKRLEILNRDEWICQFCGDQKTELHIHHLKYAVEPWEGKDEDKTTACKHCHSILEVLKTDISEEGYKVVDVVKRPCKEKGYQGAIVFVRLKDGFKSVVFYDFVNSKAKFLYAAPLDKLIDVLQGFEKL